MPDYQDPFGEKLPEEFWEEMASSPESYFENYYKLLYDAQESPEKKATLQTDMQDLRNSMEACGVDLQEFDRLIETKGPEIQLQFICNMECDKKMMSCLFHHLHKVLYGQYRILHRDLPTSIDSTSIEDLIGSVPIDVRSRIHQGCCCFYDQHVTMDNIEEIDENDVGCNLDCPHFRQITPEQLNRIEQICVHYNDFCQKETEEIMRRVESGEDPEEIMRRFERGEL